MLKDVYYACRDKLRNGGIVDAEFEAQCIVEHVTGYGRAAQIAHGTDSISDEFVSKVNSVTEKRLTRYPLQYLLQSWTFCGLPLEVGEGVLIPRDDTEVAVNLCLTFLKGKSKAKVVDLCAGSGTISVALAKFSDAEVTAVELSDKAYYFLEKNIKNNHANVTAIKENILQCYDSFADSSLDLIVSNPPYIKRDELSMLQAEVQFEPTMALDGGESGFDFYEAITKHWSRKLKKGGAMVFELGEGQAAYVTDLMQAQGLGNIRCELDLGGIQRAIIGTML